MAIDVNTLKIRIEALARKSQNGYASSVDFNSDLNDANLTIYEFYYAEFERTQKIVDALNPFIKEEDLVLTEGVLSATVAFPTDYFHRLEVGVNKLVNADNDCEPGTTVKPPIQTPYPCDYLHQSEERSTLSSPIRKPSVKKAIYRHTFKNNIIHVYPKSVPSIYFKYLRKPAVPFWNSTNESNANGDFEQYTASGSTQIEFPAQEFSMFVNLMLFYLGIETKGPLIEYAKAKMVTV